MQRRVERVIQAHRQREGGGFIVRRPLPSFGLDVVDPFLLIDEMGPVSYDKGEAAGAPDHPHRGFETVTYVLEGEIEHADSAGHRGSIGPGAVQWMTAGAGVIHSEMPSQAILDAGGRLHGFQIWVNLPRRDKMMASRYQEIAAEAIPEAVSNDGLARVRVIAGEALGVSASIETRTPIVLQHWTLQPGAKVVQPLHRDHNGLLYVFSGTLCCAGEDVREGQMAILAEGEGVELALAEDAGEEAHALLLAGQALGEPVARYGPFVMNTPEEITQAFADYRSGDFGRI